MRALAVAIAAVLLASPALAQTRQNQTAPKQPAAGAQTAAPAAAPARPQRIKGTIVSFAAPVLTVKTSRGPVDITLAANARIISNERSSLTQIKPNDFVASAAIIGTDGKLRAQEVRIFPEPLRGFGEGQYPMETASRSMTNATVQEVAGAATTRGGTLKLTFHGSTPGADGTCSGHASAPGKGACVGQTEIVVGPSVPVMRWVIGDTTWLQPGMAVSLFAAAGADGKLSTPGVIVERNGIKPLP